MLHFSTPRSAIALLMALGMVSSAAIANDSDAGVAGSSGDSSALAEGASPSPFSLRDNAFGVLAQSGGAVDSAADSGKASSKSAGDKAKAAAPADAAATESPWGDYQMGGNAPVFGGESSGVGFTQQSTTSGYEMAGSGIAGGRGAQNGLMMTAPSKGRALRLTEGLFVYPAAMIGFGFNDNVTGVETNKKSSSIFLMAPEVVAELKNRGDRYSMSYNGNYGRYQSSSADDFNHHEFWLGADNYFTTRLRTGVGVGYIEKTDARSSSLAAAPLDEPSRWHAPVLRAIGVYGAKGALGRVELEGSMMNKRYENNRATTFLSDADIVTTSGRFFYRVMPRTYALLELRQTMTDYKSANSTQDNMDRRVYLGATWEATAKTEGSIKLGRAYKNFDDATRKDASGNSWEASLRWSPLTYSVFELESGKSLYDSTGVGEYVTGTMTNLSWSHKWASYISSRLSAGKMTSDFAGATPARKDDTTTYGVAFYRELGRHLRLGLDYTNTNRDSTAVGANFKRNVTMMTLEGVF